MPLSLFDHKKLVHFRSTDGQRGAFDHSFGGDAASYGLKFVNADPPFHLIYRLDLNDPAVPVRFDGTDFLPLIYGFHYATYEGTFVYRLRSAMEIEILAPTELKYDADFPYPHHPAQFPSRPVTLNEKSYDRTVAEDALSLQAIFGLDGLSTLELTRAVRIGLSNNSYVCYSPEDLPSREWTDEETLRNLGRAPFMQGAPGKSCTNPHCTADIAYRVEEKEIEFPAEFADLLGKSTLKIEAYDVRIDTMRVIAIHEPEPQDELMWGDSYVQMVFEFCECCHCFRVSNQCT